MRDSTKILWVGLVASIVAAGAAVHWVSRVPRSAAEAAPSAAEKPASDAPAIPSAPTVAAKPGSTADAGVDDPTKKDRLLHDPFVKEYTPEQQARLAVLGGEFGELQSRISRSERDADIVRAAAAGLPGIRERVESLKAARAELDAFVAQYPARLAAASTVVSASARDAECRGRSAAFRAHVESHLRTPTDPAATCEWCRRDSARMAARDSALGRRYKTEGEAFAAAACSAADELAKARIALATVVRSASASPEGRALSMREESARKAVDEAMGSLPELARLRAGADDARARQKEIAAEMAEIHGNARNVPSSVARSETGGGTGRRAP